LSRCKRVVLFNLVRGKDGESYVEFRHYGISARQREVSKQVKRLVNSKKIPNLAKYNDIADFLLAKKGMADYSSGSEMDDIPESRLVLPEDFQDKKKNTSVSIKLHEIGPRLKLKLHKIQEGLCRGNVVMHSLVSKSKGEIKKQMDDLKKKRELKAERKRI